MPNKRPAEGEYSPFYSTYVDQVPVGPVLDTLRQQKDTTQELLSRIPEEAGDHRYSEFKWSIKEVLGHVIDAERVFQFRALHFARKATGEIPGMDQDDFASTAPYGARPISSIAAELRLVRSANIEQYAFWDAATLAHTGVASGVGFSVRALLYIMAGHEQHHMRVLKERYL